MLRRCATGWTPAPAALCWKPKTAQALADLTELIRARRLKKEYLCVTFGRPEPPAATLTGWLKKDAAKGRVTVVDRPAADAVPIETRYETMAVSGRLALLRVELITGRTHQIRAHLASIGCPILGDGKYGQNAVNRQLHFKYQALYAWRLYLPGGLSTLSCFCEREMLYA